jgi:hypothetical protein
MAGNLSENPFELEGGEAGFSQEQVDEMIVNSELGSQAVNAQTIAIKGEEAYTPDPNKNATTESKKGGGTVQTKTASKKEASVTYETKKEGSGRTATPRSGWADDDKAKDNPFSSITNANIVDLICEGPIEGICDDRGQTVRSLSSDPKARDLQMDPNIAARSIFLDDTPIKTKGGHLNFRRFNAKMRHGLPSQSAVQGYQGRTIALNKTLYPNNKWNAVEFPSETVASSEPTIEQKRARREQFMSKELYLNPITHAIVDKNVTEAVVAINIHVLTRSVTGKREVKVKPHDINFLIYAGNDGEEDGDGFWENPVMIEVPGLKYGAGKGEYGWAEAHGEGEATNAGRKSRLISNDTGGFFLRRLRGLATSDYVFETIVHFPPNVTGTNRIIRVSRIDAEADMTNMKDQQTAQASLRSITEIVPYRLNYPNSAIISTNFDSKAYAQIPKRNYLLKLQKVQVPSNYLPDIKRHVGNWDGRFKTRGTFIHRHKADKLLSDETNIFTRSGAAVAAKSPSSFGAGKGFEINTSTKKSGGGSLRFKAQGDNPDSSDKVIRVYDGGAGYGGGDLPFSNWTSEIPWAVEDLGMANFGAQNFTIEFHVKITASELQTVYNLSGGTESTAGVQGVNKVILASDNNAGLGIINSGTATGELSREEQMKHLNLAIVSSSKFGSGSQGILGGGWKISVSTNPVGVLYFEHFVSSAAVDYIKIHKEEGEDNAEEVGSWDEEAYGAAVTQAKDTGQPVPKRALYERNILLTADIAGSNRIADDEWHHVAIVRNGDAIKLYVDGATEDTGGMVGKKNVYGVRVQEGEYAGAGELQIGGSRTPYVNVGGTVYDSTFVGYIDDLHIANSAVYAGDTISTTRQENIKNSITTRLFMSFDSDIKDEPVALVDIDYLSIQGGNPNSSYLQWTDNPAWIFYDLATNPRYGMGKYGVTAQSVDKWSLYQISRYCDELVRTGFTSTFPHRSFDFVDDNPTVSPLSPSFDPQVKAGTTYIRIKNFNNQAEFQAEFPEGSIINIYDLNDSKNSGHQKQIKYLRTVEDPTNPFKANVGSTGTETDEQKKLLSYEADIQSSGDAIVEIQDILSTEEVLRLDENLTSILSKLRSEHPSHTDQELIFTYMQSPKGLTSLTKQVFDFGAKVNDTSVSGKVCAELSDYYPFLEPRFTANIYIDGVTDGIRVLNDVAAIFRGITYYAGGNIVPTHDRARDPVMIFTNSNVSEGVFTYSGSSKSDRYSVCKVRFNDKKDKYKQRIEFIEDPSGIIKYGYNEKDLAALGCTSRGQARRLGRWFLYSAQHETETVSFTTSKIAGYLMPGDVVKVMDKNRISEKNFGTVVGFPQNQDGKLKIKIDSEINEKYVGEKITVAISQRFNTIEKLDYLSDHVFITSQNTLGTETSKVSDQEISDLRKVQLYTFTIKNIEKDTAVVPNVNTIVEIESTEDSVNNFGKIKLSAPYSVQKANDEIKIKETLYRVINIKQSSLEEYEIEGLEYNKSKHETIDFFEDFEEVTQQSPSIKDRPTKMINPPRLNIIKSDDPQVRNLLVSWDAVSPSPYAYHIVLRLFPQAVIDWAQGANEGGGAGFDEFGIKTLKKSVKTQTDDGNVGPTNAIFNIGSYFGEITTMIYTVDENGNTELVYY